MNILVDAPPESLTVDGRTYNVNADFRSILNVMLAFEDETLTSGEHGEILLRCIYGDDIPPNLKSAYEKALWFINCGRERDSDGVRVFSFAKDADFIFAAFRQTHGIDLQTADLHWWTFYALFMDLGADTTFCQLTGLRRRVYTGKATKDERQAAQAMGDLFDVPARDERTLDEKIAERRFLELIGN